MNEENEALLELLESYIERVEELEKEIETNKRERDYPVSYERYLHSIWEQTPGN